MTSWHEQPGLGGLEHHRPRRGHRPRHPRRRLRHRRAPPRGRRPRREPVPGRLRDQEPGGRPQHVTPLLARLVRASLDVAQRTQGSVDPTVGSALDGLGYDRDIAAGGAAETAARVAVLSRAVPGWRAGQPGGPVRSPLPAGVAARPGRHRQGRRRPTGPPHWSPTGWRPACWSASAATSRPPAAAPAAGWQVHVAGPPGGPGHPGRAAGRRRARHVEHRPPALGCRGGQTAPPHRRPGAPAAGRSVWRTVTVAADTCLQANAVRTAAIVRRARRGLGWLHRCGLPARLVGSTARRAPLGGWPDGVAAA